MCETKRDTAYWLHSIAIGSILRDKGFLFSIFLSFSRFYHTVATILYLKHDTDFVSDNRSLSLSIFFLDIPYLYYPIVTNIHGDRVYAMFRISSYFVVLYATAFRLMLLVLWINNGGYTGA